MGMISHAYGRHCWEDKETGRRRTPWGMVRERPVRQRDRAHGRNQSLRCRTRITKPAKRLSGPSQHRVSMRRSTGPTTGKESITG